MTSPGELFAPELSSAGAAGRVQRSAPWGRWAHKAVPDPEPTFPLAEHELTFERHPGEVGPAVIRGVLQTVAIWARPAMRLDEPQRYRPTGPWRGISTAETTPQSGDDDMGRDFVVCRTQSPNRRVLGTSGEL
jgi:hypothetical protein